MTTHKTIFIMMLNFKSLCATLDEVGLFLNTITHCATSAVTATTTATKTDDSNGSNSICEKKHMMLSNSISWVTSAKLFTIFLAANKREEYRQQPICVYVCAVVISGLNLYFKFV